MFEKGFRLRNRWRDAIGENGGDGSVLDVCLWTGRATFDVIGTAGLCSISHSQFDTNGTSGFDYEFNSIEDATNELFRAYREMFELSVSQQRSSMRTLLGIYFPIIDVLFVSKRRQIFGVSSLSVSIQPDLAARTVKKCHKVIWRVAGTLVQEKKKKVMDALQRGETCEDNDLLALMCTFIF